MESGSQAYGVHQIRHIGIIAIVDDLGALSVTAEACDPALAGCTLQRGLAGAPTSALPGSVVGRSAQFSRRSSRPKAALGLLHSPTGPLDAVGAWPCPSARGHSGARGHATQ